MLFVCFLKSCILFLQTDGRANDFAFTAQCIFVSFSV